ncbi:uncharacterized protein SPSK_05767 [Sporothrix schenckii 1099-18]|uniref:Uncharacterized protein n=1 Tax=Sporothrix schenckii 1099-18 TaxID=1397361 RepID=A0A0F2LU36_SPOSC|nr:uncharacterized protein SPSK_05767 [Sporothrix schenckii 1099-18]KJR80967.1 hypothetical protein SPSK_05767 [Sporothrix schenckii 1099-18]
MRKERRSRNPGKKEAETGRSFYFLRPPAPSFEGTASDSQLVVAMSFQRSREAATGVGAWHALPHLSSIDDRDEN